MWLFPVSMQKPLHNGLERAIVILCRSAASRSRTRIWVLFFPIPFLLFLLFTQFDLHSQVVNTSLIFPFLITFSCLCCSLFPSLSQSFSTLPCRFPVSYHDAGACVAQNIASSTRSKSSCGILIDHNQPLRSTSMFLPYQNSLLAATIFLTSFPMISCRGLQRANHENNETANLRTYASLFKDGFSNGTNPSCASL